jgi:hypothetical protein
LRAKALSQLLTVYRWVTERYLERWCLPSQQYLRLPGAALVITEVTSGCDDTNACARSAQMEDSETGAELSVTSKGKGESWEFCDSGFRKWVSVLVVGGQFRLALFAGVIFNCCAPPQAAARMPPAGRK